MRYRLQRRNTETRTAQRLRKSFDRCEADPKTGKASGSSCRGEQVHLRQRNSGSVESTIDVSQQDARMRDLGIADDRAKNFFATSQTNTATQSRCVKAENDR